MESKTGVYICKGCGIGECLNVDKLAGVAKDEFRAPTVRIAPAFCLEDVQIIKDDIASGAVQSAVIAACSPRVNTEVFDLKPTLVQRVDLREQVAWSHAPNSEETQSLAHDQLRMGLVRAQKTQPPTPYTEANERTVLVVGGGITGMTAALDVADAGYDAILVEKEAALGGYAAKMHLTFPSRAPYTKLQDLPIAGTVKRVQAHPNIKIFLNAEIGSIAGQPGHFDVSIRQNSATQNMPAGAVVMATGWKPYDAAQLQHYGFGKYPNVVSSVMLETMARDGAIRRPSDGGAVRTAAIIQCETPADESHLPYSGNITSLVMLKQALYMRETDEQRRVFVVYQDMQTPGQQEYFYKHVQRDEGILFSQGNVSSVSEDDRHNIILEIANTVLGSTVRLRADLLVLSTGMTPAPGNGGALHLQYLQGPEVPPTKFGFADSHFICFPYETRRTGIYSAGCVRQPMDALSSAKDGTAAALKAIQCIEKSSAGAAVHPRVGDLSYPEFFMQKCTSCGRCSQECPFGALELNEKKNPVLDPNRCRRCGICMGACPVQIISFDDYSVDMLSSMIRSVEMPEGDDEKLRILVFACENDAYPALDMAGIERLQYPANIRVIPVRCLGSVNSVLIADAVSRGFDGVALMGCKSGEDYQCHFIQGSELLGKRMENVRETLNRLVLEPERVRVDEVAISDYRQVPGMLADFVGTVKKLGPNPFKGF